MAGVAKKPSVIVPGYQSRLDAFMDVVRFGPEFLSSAEFPALLFHVERSLPYNKLRDCASMSQMVSGVFSKKSNTWIRGGSGLSESGARKGNRDLIEKGLLKSCNKTRENGADSSTEFEVQWEQVRAFFKEKTAQKPIGSKKPGRPKTRVHQEHPIFESEETRVHQEKGEGARGAGGRVHVVQTQSIYIQSESSQSEKRLTRISSGDGKRLPDDDPQNPRLAASVSVAVVSQNLSKKKSQKQNQKQQPAPPPKPKRVEKDHWDWTEDELTQCEVLLGNNEPIEYGHGIDFPIEHALEQGWIQRETLDAGLGAPVEDVLGFVSQEITLLDVPPPTWAWYPAIVRKEFERRRREACKPVAGSPPKHWTAEEKAEVRESASRLLTSSPDPDFETSIWYRVRFASAAAVCRDLDLLYGKPAYRHPRGKSRFRNQNAILETLGNMYNGYHCPEHPARPHPDHVAPPGLMELGASAFEGELEEV